MTTQVNLDYILENFRELKVRAPVLKLAGNNYFLILRQEQKELCATLKEDEFLRLVNQGKLNYHGGTA